MEARVSGTLEIIISKVEMDLTTKTSEITGGRIIDIWQGKMMRAPS